VRKAARVPAFRATLLATLLAAGPAIAALPDARELAALCTGAEGPVHCGRLVEAAQLARSPGLATRSGDELTVRLRDGRTRAFADGKDASFAMWGEIEAADAVVLMTTRAEAIGFTVIQRATGSLAELPSEPIPSPDGAHFATADFCDKGCDNEIAVWRVSPERIRKDRFFRPRTTWRDVTLRWKDGNTLHIERQTPASAPSAFDFRLTDPGWMRIDAK
jgi:hypothetical protein